MTTLEDALHAVRTMREQCSSVGSKIILDFLEQLERQAAPESVIDTDADGYIVEGAYQNGFDFIDDNAGLLVVHQNDLIKYVWAQRVARWVSPARCEMQPGLVAKAWRSGGVAITRYNGSPKLAGCDFFIQLPPIPQETT